MFKKVDMYIVECDRCGKNAFEDDEFSAWGCESDAWERASEYNEFIEIDGKHICDDCRCWDEKDEEQIIKKGKKE